MLSQPTMKLFALALVLLLAAVLFAACGPLARERQKRKNTRRRPRVEVMTAAAIQTELPRFFEATGSLAAISRQTSPRTAGRSSRWRRNRQCRQAGQMLVRLDDAERTARRTGGDARSNRRKRRCDRLKRRSACVRGRRSNPNRVAEVAAAEGHTRSCRKDLVRAQKLIESGVCRVRSTTMRGASRSLREQYEGSLRRRGRTSRAVGVRAHPTSRMPSRRWR